MKLPNNYINNCLIAETFFVTPADNLLTILLKQQPKVALDLIQTVINKALKVDFTTHINETLVSLKNKDRETVWGFPTFVMTGDIFSLSPLLPAEQMTCMIALTALFVYPNKVRIYKEDFDTTLQCNPHRHKGTPRHLHNQYCEELTKRVNIKHSDIVAAGHKLGQLIAHYLQTHNLESQYDLKFCRFIMTCEPVPDYDSSHLLTSFTKARSVNVLIKHLTELPHSNDEIEQL